MKLKEHIASTWSLCSQELDRNSEMGYYVTLIKIKVILHAICDNVYVTQYNFKKSKMVTMLKFEAFRGTFVFKNVSNKQERTEWR